MDRAMDVHPANAGHRVRARAVWGAGRLAPKAFRIEDQDGRLLRTIRDAAHGQDALARYWRGAGATLPGALPRALIGAAMSQDLERRIRGLSASGRNASRASMQTPELPFDEDAAPEPVATPHRARTARAAAPAVPQTDLFDQPPVAEAAPSAEPESEPEPVPVDLPATPRVLDPQAVSLQRVDARNLRPTDHADSYLYHVTLGADAETALRDGLGISASDPAILTERQGVAYWLSILAEDYDYILDGPADFVVLRMRRLAVEDLLEADPHASRSAGCPCFLLTGGAAARLRG